MVVAERLAEPVEFVDQRSDDARRRLAQEAHLVPELLRRLAPLVHVLVGGVALCRSQRTASASIGGGEALGDRIEAAADLPPVSALLGLDEQLACDDDPFVTGLDRTGRFCGEGGLVIADRPEAIVEVVRSQEVVERGEERMGVAHRGELGGGIAHGPVERFELVAERRSHESGEPTRLLAALADVVNGGLDVGRPGEHRVELFDRVTETLGRDAANLSPHGDLRIEHISHCTQSNPHTVPGQT